MHHSLELEVIRFIQEFRTPLSDGFFKFLNYFDRQEFLFVLIPAIWLTKGWKWGLRLFYILFLNSYANHILKLFFISPRPFHIDSTVSIIQVEGYGFPSGAAQTVILLSGILVNYWKSKWKWPVIFFYITSISFSRVYLGVHFPTDIFAGWITGFFLWGLFTYVRPSLENQLEQLNPSSLLVISQLIPIVLLFSQYSPSALRICISAMGIGMGLYINHSFGWSLSPSKTLFEDTIKIMIGIIGTFFCYFFASYLFWYQSLPSTFCKYLIVSLWITTGSLLVCNKLMTYSKLLVKATLE